ncbi:MAG: DUF58 domain-containing protein [Candidatus Scalindua sp. AMX11]|nr:MAG: DUF58 domain-containing protein [Candidatus Scalindua sp.]NOG85469.1 DUF58 domain-containing protein [Planctomycetota bacterium]RZV90279.1 MAG: DUF58 domain-containing protein [Candidatus Scalindua sp. SCAELEC01]TDE64689.1 MAG: DUF58 domain-containing protein [Candidatus Scalindua sp. AMX11]GJQ60797.1 MAG: DUF58 domain-containing protein [Candidatus Scalindua sp.]
MIPKEILKKVKQIQIRSSRLVNDVLAGEYVSVFKGRGMEFEEVREYQMGDDIRSIDWNVTARLGHPYIKRFSEERELTIMFLVDLSSSGKFGSVTQFKNEIATEACALLALSAVRNNDKVGLILFTDRIEKFVPPKKGKTHVLRLIREVLYFKPERKGTDISVALEYLIKITKRKTVSFLMSDFLTSDFERTLRITNKRHDMIAVSITDPRELELPNVGFIKLKDAETGEIKLVDTSDQKLRREFCRQNAKNREERKKMFRGVGVDMIDLRTDSSYVEPIMNFFRMRERRLKY